MANMFAREGKDLVPVRLEGDELEQAVQAGWVEIAEDGTPDTIYIIRKLSYGSRQDLVGMASKMEMSADTLREAKEANARGEDIEPEMAGGFDIGRYNKEQLVIWVRSWQGPSFEGIPCTRENKLDLDFENPLVKKTLEEMGKRARPTDKQSPKP